MYTRSCPRRILRQLATALALGSAGFGMIDCADQPKPYCVVSPYPFAVKLLETNRSENMPGACDGFGPQTFNADARVGVVPFYPSGKNGDSDYTNGSVGIQTAEVGSIFYRAMAQGVQNTAPGGQVYSLGKFADSRPDERDLCHVPSLSPTHVVVAEVPGTPDDPATDDDESVPLQPAMDIRLVWSNVDIYVVPANYGTQFQADLVDTRVAPNGSTCTIRYRALGLSPSTSCQEEDGALDPKYCQPLDDPDNAQSSGSEITIDTDYQCDPATGYCQINGNAIPAIK